MRRDYDLRNEWRWDWGEYMGTWSAGITGNDTALDMIEDYKVAFSYFDVATGLKKLDQFVRSNFDESDED